MTGSSGRVKKYVQRELPESLLIAAVTCYAFTTYPGRKKKLELLDRGLWKPRVEARKTRTQITYRIILFLLGVALLMKSYSVEPNLVDVLQISGLLTAVAGITLIITYVVGKKTLTPV